MACPPPPPPPSSRPPPLTRVSSEGTSSIHTRMAEATISGHHPSMSLSQPPPPPPPPQQQSVQPPPPQLPVSTSMYQRQVNITSPLAMHSVQHTSVAPSLLQGHHPLSPVPVWQRASSAGYALYGQWFFFIMFLETIILYLQNFIIEILFLFICLCPFFFLAIYLPKSWVLPFKIIHL